LLASKTPEGEALFKKLIDEQRMSIVDVIKAFPSCQSIPLEGLIGVLPGIPPRYYSVSSSPLDPRNGALALTVAFSVVDYLTPSLEANGIDIGRRRIGGVATRFLEVLCSGFLSGASNSPPPTTLQIFPKPTTEFQLPTSLSTPLILIGPGTGIAPFVGFLRHRQAQSQQSQQAATSVVEGTWRGDYEMEADDLPVSKRDAPGGVLQQRNLGKIQVFFGCRRSDHDWLFQEEMEQLKQESVISDLYTAFSRQEPKTYVQDIMVHDEVCRASLVNLLLKENAAVYICGDGNQMAKDVQNALMQVLSPHVKDARAHLETMKKQRRLLMDIWTS
jgi:sulfite reductase alpha subunit-like flavoprotein